MVDIESFIVDLDNSKNVDLIIKARLNITEEFPFAIVFHTFLSLFSKAGALRKGKPGIHSSRTFLFAFETRQIKMISKHRMSRLKLLMSLPLLGDGCIFHLVLNGGILVYF